ncbi:class I SAM-dependent methyltransferase [Sulfuriflexus sp.]|uniref:class I SAM-dependent methyltransferase n=1 Tax=Sulfuriflexus sp. TaxID=2015443 RepID=UPI0028CBF778|nr:class I SAM-dependent methyltransferase [Sulfuriflexus sp.]MDT8404592.1 class I SAM-dependent methyltransferase [Sulfuriflexus sp.]
MIDWNERFAETAHAYGTEPNDFLREWAGRVPAGRVLCLAEGQGRNAVFMAEQGYAVTAVDASEVGLARARELAAERGVVIETCHADLNTFVIEPGQWQGVVSVFCHLPADVRQRVHASVVKGLAPGGVLILEAYTPAQIALNTGGPRDAALCMQLEELQQELAGLRFLHARETEREVVEGKYHYGKGAVVQIVAVKE